MISIYNSSKYEFELTKGKVQHGKWASEPPAKIPVHSIGRFGTFSKNKFGSTKGYAKYTAIIKGKRKFQKSKKMDPFNYFFYIQRSCYRITF